MEFLLSVTLLTVRYFDAMTSGAYGEEFERVFTLAKKVSFLLSNEGHFRISNQLFYINRKSLFTNFETEVDL